MSRAQKMYKGMETRRTRKAPGIVASTILEVPEKHALLAKVKAKGGTVAAYIRGLILSDLEGK